MKSKLSNRTSVIAALAAIALASTLTLSSRMTNARPSPSPSGEDESVRGGRVLVGAWRVKVQLHNCQTNSPLGNPFSSLLTFNEGGTLSGITNNSGFAVGQRGIDQGAWEHDGHRSYEAKSAAFIFFTTPPNPPMNPGFQAGIQTISQKIEFDSNPDEFTSEAAIEFFDASGASYRKGCASATAQRFE